MKRNGKKLGLNKSTVRSLGQATVSGGGANTLFNCSASSTVASLAASCPGEINCFHFNTAWQACDSNCCNETAVSNCVQQSCALCDFGPSGRC